MTFRTRIFLSMVAVSVLPLLLLLVMVRQDLRQRFAREDSLRLAGDLDRIRQNLQALGAATRLRLERLATDLEEENRFRLALLDQDPDAQAWLRNWAAGAIRGSRLALLQLQDSSGTILSSGHNRAQFGQTAAVPADSSTPFVALALTPGRRIATLAMTRSLGVAGRRFFLTGGTLIDTADFSRQLAGGTALQASLRTPLDSTPPSSDVVAQWPLPVQDLTGVGDAALAGTATLLIRGGEPPSAAMRRSLNRGFLLGVALALIAALGLSGWIAGRVARPLGELAGKTARLDLDRLDQSFASDRQDEIGTLANLLDAMTDRLRVGAQRLREAERRAVTGDLARQINHDVRNGLAPIRHVLRHLTQVAERNPEQLAPIFRERQGTLESSLEYLETMARNYARLSPRMDQVVTDAAELLAQVARAQAGSAAQVELRVPTGPAPVRADPVVLRRILENLVTNGLDAMNGRPDARLTLACEPTDGADPRVRLTVSDNGRGMTREALDRAFDDFFTTKSGGTGLGLSVVRRLVADLGGRLRVETAPGQGSRFIVELPAAGPGGIA